MFLNAEEKFDRQTLISNKNLIPLFFIWDRFIEKIERAERETGGSLGIEVNVRRSDGQAREVGPFFRFDVSQLARGLTLKDTHTHICSAFVSV